MTVRHPAARRGLVSKYAQSDDEAELEEVEDYGELNRLLSRSFTIDAYCRSAFYFAFTGRGKLWTIRCRDKCLIVLRHPNVAGTVLVFFPFVSSALDLAEQVDVLCRTKAFVSRFKNFEIFLARVPALFAEGLLSKRCMSSLNWKLEQVDETRLDWIYPSYDIELKRLLNPQGRRLKSFRKKIRKYLDKEIEVIRPMDLSPAALVKAVREVNRGWIRTKLLSRNFSQTGLVSPRELMSCYRSMVRLHHDASLAIDGLILRRGESYAAFAFWERPAHGGTVPCLAALPASHEKGLSEYLYYTIARYLGAEGYNEMCIGGSETASLDKFKRKLYPSRVHKLLTIGMSLSAQFG